MKKLLTISLIFCALSGFSQKKADRLFRDLSFIEAAQEYEKYMEKTDTPSLEAIKNLADSYYYTNDIRNALKWYKKIYSIQGSNISNKYYLRLIQSMRGVRDYDSAYYHAKKFYKRKGDSLATAMFISQKKRLDSLAEVESLYKIRNLENVNSAGSEFGPAYYADKLVFSSTQDSAQFGKSLYSWNKQPFLALYVADRNGTTGELHDVRKFMPDIESKYHDATLTFSSDTSTVYYTTNISKGNRIFFNDERTNNFQIIKAKMKDGKLVDPEPLFIGSKDYSVGHPSLSDDGKLFFFVSDMPGGYGETDIYVAEVFEDGTMNTPRNLGPKINTEAKEMFPFYQDSTLYFSSTGHYGLGGLDVFESKMTGKLEFTEPQNLGEPINSNWDDFSFIIDSTGTKGYFSSNRILGGKGDDDLYYFTKSKPPCENLVSGHAIDSLTNMPLRDVSVKAYDKFDDVIAEVKTDEAGMYEISLPCGEVYNLVATKENYTEDKEKVTTLEKNGHKIEGVDFILTNYDDLVEEKEGAEMISVNPIYFEFDKSDITPQAAEELDKVVYVMREFPNVRIKIESHADARGSDNYNLELSDRRAKSTRDYIISKGIEAHRIESAIGYGETRPVNECINGIPCSDEEHLQNRRSNFIVIQK